MKPQALLSCCACLNCRFSKEYVRASFENKARYCAMHEIDCILNRQLEEPAIHPKWEKLNMLRDATRRYNKIVWMDCDTIFTNFSKTFDAYNTVGMHASYTKNAFNTGVFVLVNGDGMTNFVNVWKSFQYNVDNFKEYQHADWKDQQALRHMIMSNITFKTYLHRVRMREINSFAQEGPHEAEFERRWRKGDFVYHDVGYWGLTEAQKWKRIQKFIALANDTKERSR
jgi:hypothetical protein